MDILCSGPHLTGLAPVLGSSDVLVSGMLCGDCGLAYAYNVTNGTPIETIPTADTLAVALTVVKPKYDKTSYQRPKV